jgi:hypothetical protein
MQFVEDLARIVYLLRKEVESQPEKFQYLVTDKPNAVDVRQESFAVLASSKTKSGIDALRLEMAQFANLTMDTYLEKQSNKVFFL